MRLQDLGEFGLIDQIQRAAARVARPGVRIGIGDDAAVLRLRSGEDLVVTTDALVEDVHFRWPNESPATIGRRALAASLSDLAAMGARPLGCVLALAAPADLSAARIRALIRGMLRESARYACPLVGGNVSRARETSLSITALGGVARGRALTRSQARAGDAIWVTGSLGGAALARLRAERGLARVRRVPEPRLAAGRALSRLRGAGACIDLSDGLEADLERILEASCVGAEIDARRVPRPRGFAAACARLGVDPERLALGGGEDYELLFTTRAPLEPGGLARRLGVRVTSVGRITERRRRTPDRPRRGWRHF